MSLVTVMMMIVKYKKRYSLLKMNTKFYNTEANNTETSKLYYCLYNYFFVSRFHLVQVLS